MANCKLCDRVLAGEYTGDAGVEVYCCHGCEAVDQIISSMELPDDERAAKKEQLLATIFSSDPKEEEHAALDREFADQPDHDLQLQVGGMVCPACSWIIHHALEKQHGVSSASINFISETATIKFNPMRIGQDKIEEEISKLGYSVREDSSPSAGFDYTGFGAGWFFAINVMMLSFVVYSAESWSIPILMQRVCWILMAIFTVLTMFLGARATFHKGYMQIRHLDFRMETLILLSSVTALTYSFYSVWAGDFSRLYFDVVCLLLMLVETGNLITTAFYTKLRRRVFEMVSFLPKKVRLAGERENYRNTKDLDAGTPFEVRQGEVVSTDGILLQEAEFDFSLINGESNGIVLQPGQLVGAGAKLLSSSAVLTVPKGGTSSLIENIVNSTINAFSTNQEAQSMGDRISHWFVPVVFCVAVGGGAMHLVQGDIARGITTFMSILIVACPCAFGIAEPLVLTLAVGKAKELGIQVFNGNALRNKITSIIFDKTGTLTGNSMTVAGIHWLVDEQPAELDILASLESGVEHPIAKALAPLGAGVPIENRSIQVGCITGEYQGKTYRCGKPAVFENLEIPAELQGNDATLVAFGDENGCRLLIRLTDDLRPESREVCSDIQNLGTGMHICSGDHEGAVARISGQLDMPFKSDMSPSDKQAFIRELQEKGETVMMVGDGINDAQSLAAADFGMAVFSGQFPAQMSADAVFLVPSLQTLPRLLRRMKTIRSRIFSNYAWAFAYNIVGVSLALAGLLTPTFCAVGMVFSNFVVIINSLRSGKE